MKEQRIHGGRFGAGRRIVASVTAEKALAEELPGEQYRLAPGGFAGSSGQTSDVSSGESSTFIVAAERHIISSETARRAGGFCKLK